MLKRKRPIIIIVSLIILLISLFLLMFQNIPKKKPEAATSEKVYLYNAKSLAYKTAKKGTKEGFIFGLERNEQYKVFPAIYCLNLGEKAYSGTIVKNITDKVKKEAAAAMRWGYQKNYTSGKEESEEDIRNKNLLKYEYQVTGYTGHEFRFATQLAVWMSLDSKGGLHGYEPADVNNKIYVLAKKIAANAKADLGKSLEDVGPQAIKVINPSNIKLVAEKDKLKVGPYSYETSVYGYPYKVSIVKKSDSDKEQFYEGEYPKGFQIKSNVATFTAATRWNSPDSSEGELKAANRKKLTSFISKNFKSGATKNKKLKMGDGFYIYVDKDANMKDLKELTKHIRVFVEGLDNPKKEKKFFYDISIDGYQDFARLSSVQDKISEGIDLNIETGGAQLKIIKYPSDAKFTDGFTFDSTDPQAWSNHNNNRVEDDPEAILNQKIEDAIAQNTDALLANGEFLQAFSDFKSAVTNGDKDTQDRLSGKYRMLLFYAQNDPDHDDLSEVLQAYHETLVEEADIEFGETGGVTEPIFKLLYEEYAQNKDKGSIQLKINAKFMIQAPKGAFENTKYAEEAKDSGNYSYLKVKTQNGQVSIAGLKKGKYIIAEQEVLLDTYQTDGSQKLYTNINGTKKIQDSTATESFTYDGEKYTGSVLDITESTSESINYYDFAKINYAAGTLMVEKTAKLEAGKTTDQPCDAVFRLVGLTPNASHPMKSGQADDPLANGGYNFRTMSGSERVTGLVPGDYVLYEYRKGQIYTDEDGNELTMEPGYEEYDTNPQSDKTKLLEVYRFTVKAGRESSSVPFTSHVENLPTPALAFVKLDGEEYETSYKDFTNEEVRRKILLHFEDSESFLTRIDVSFRVTGISPGASYPDGKLFETVDNVCMVTDLSIGTYRIQEESILSSDGSGYDVNRKVYEIELTRGHTKDDPYLIVHPNYVSNPIYADLVLNKTDNLAFPMSGVTFSCASYLGEYTKGYNDNALSQKNPDNRYDGKEYYAEGTVKDGEVSFENIRVEVDGDNNVTTWLHLHELVTKAGYDPVPTDKDGKPWDDYAEQCPTCQNTGMEKANGLDMKLDIKAFPKAKGRKTITVLNNRIEADTAYLAIHKTTPAGLFDIAGAEFELYTNEPLGNAEKIPLGFVLDGDNGEMVLTTLEPNDTTTPQVNMVTDNNGQVRVKFTKTWLDKCERFKVKEISVPPPYVINQVETSFRLFLGDFAVLPITNNVEGNEPGKIVIKKVAANETMTPLEGAIFGLYHAIQDGEGNWIKEEGTPFVTGMTDRNGIIEFNNLSLAMPYIAEEIQAPDGYEIMESSKNILIVAAGENDDTVVEVINTKERVQIEVIKTDLENGERLAGAEFWIRDEANHVIAILKTDENGYAISKKLEKWDASKPHTIEEGVPPTGYELPTGGGKQPILLEEGKQVYSFSYVDEKIKGTVKIHKTSTDNASLLLFPLTGTRFELRKQGTEPVLETLIIDETGYSQTSKPLEVGKYTITETYVSDGYYMDKDGDHIPDTIGYSKNFEIKTNETLTIDCVNEPISGKLEIHKLDSKDGAKAVGGVVFDLYRDDGSKDGVYLETLVTDENGIAFSSNTLYQGNYFIIETKAPPNYWVDPTPRPFVIDKNNMGLIKCTITNDLVELNIRVHKMNDKKQNLQGVGFTLFDQKGDAVLFHQVIDEEGNTKEVSEFFTNDEGIILFPQKVGYGTYTLKETTTPPKYKKADDITFVIDHNTKYVEIEAIGKTVTHEVINYPKHASLQIVKIDKDTRLPLSGVEFLLSCKGNDFEQTYTTNADGKIEVSGLLMGEYLWIETKPKPGYLGTLPDGTPIKGTITITEDGKEYQVIVENEKPEKEPGKIKVRKVDKESKAPLMGAIFTLSDSNGDLISSQVSDANGYAIFLGLMPGFTYQVEEMQPPAGYTLPTPAILKIPVKEGGTVEVTFEDEKKVEEKKKGKLIIHKESATDKRALAGAVFRITNLQGYENQVMTPTSGSIVLTDLEFGEYKVEEIVPPPNYQLAQNPIQTVLIIEAQAEVTVTFQNKEQPPPITPGELWLTKTDITTGKPLPNAVFRILDGQKKEVTRGMTDELGMAKFKLEEGNYYYQEAIAPNSYVLDETLYQFTIKGGQIIKATMTNKKKEGTLKINKVDALGGIPVPNCTFVILNEQKQVILRDTTDRYGFCGFTLPFGVYYYQEEKAAPGYILDNQAYRFEITTNGQIIYETVKNIKEGKGKLVVLKLDSKSHLPVAGSKFAILKDTGVKIAEGITDQNGFCEFLLGAGNYIYQEIEAPPGYVLDPTPHPFVVTYSGQVITKTVYNQKKPEEEGTLHIHKIDQETKEALKDALITIKDKVSGKVVMEKRTDASGDVTFQLPIGNYTYQETQAPQGYVLDSTATEVSIKAGTKVIQIVMVNVKEPDTGGKLIITKMDREDASKLIADTKFTIIDKNTGEIKTQGLTDEVGKVVFPLPIGSYTYQESEAAKGYVLDDTPHDFVIKENKESVSVVVWNTKKPKEGGTLIITKQDSQDSSILIPDTQITIKDKVTGETIQQKSTDANGMVAFTLPIGSYSYQENKAAKGYVLDETAHDFQIKGDSEVIEEVLLNKKMTQVWLVKEDLKTHAKLAGVHFAIFNENGEKIREGVTNEDGILKMQLKAGTYAYQEQKAAPGYLLDDTMQTFVIDGEEQVVKYTVTNVKQTIHLPKTGDKIGKSTLPFYQDFGNLFLPLFLLAGSGVILFFHFYTKKNKEKEGGEKSKEKEAKGKKE